MIFCWLSRSVVEISGLDALNFLQSLITNDIKKLTLNNSIYSLILNSKGRYLYDFFLTLKEYNPEKPEITKILVDIDNNNADEFIKNLNFYKLRSKIKINLTNYKVGSFFDPQSVENNCVQIDKFWLKYSMLKSNTNHFESHILIKDPRLNILGGRVITESSFDYKVYSNLSAETEHSYDIYRYKNAIAEASELVKNTSIPIEYGFDELGAISYNKGCYIGQEFTNSAKRLLKIRKRIIVFKAENKNLKKGDVIYNDNHERVGSIKAVCEGFNEVYILGLVKMNMILNQNNNHKAFIAEKAKLTASIPSWISYYSLD